MYTQYMGSLSFRQLFGVLFVSFCALLATSLVYAWTGPTAFPPGNNVDAPINVGTTSQIKDGTIGVNGLGVFGDTYIEDKLGVGVVSPVVAIETLGTLKIGSGGEVCQSVTEGAVRYNTTDNSVEFCDGVSWSSLSSSGIEVLPTLSRPTVTGSTVSNPSSWQSWDLSSHVPVGTTAVFLTYYCTQSQLLVKESGSAAGFSLGTPGVSSGPVTQGCAARNNTIDYSSGWVQLGSDRTVQYVFGVMDGQTGGGQIRLDAYVQ